MENCIRSCTIGWSKQKKEKRTELYIYISKKERKEIWKEIKTKWKNVRVNGGNKTESWYILNEFWRDVISFAWHNRDKNRNEDHPISKFSSSRFYLKEVNLMLLSDVYIYIYINLRNRTEIGCYWKWSSNKYRNGKMSSPHFVYISIHYLSHWVNQSTFVIRNIYTMGAIS